MDISLTNGATNCIDHNSVTIVVNTESANNISKDHKLSNTQLFAKSGFFTQN